MSAPTVLAEYAPGIHASIPELEYHTLPGLSSTGIKHLLDCPARYEHERTHRTEKKAFDLGHAVHELVLGEGMGIEVVEADSWRTKAAQEARDAARAAGLVPMLVADHARARVAADAVLAHPDAGRLLTGGMPEVSVLWDDPTTGVRCRGRLDYWHEGAHVVVDLKTTARSAAPRGIDRLAQSLGWHTQAAHYRAGVEHLTGRAPRFLHVVVEVDAPHLVSVVELDADYLAIGAADVRHAIDTYAHCAESGEWPGYAPGVHQIAPPRWLDSTPTEEA
ncbi:PDDEXK-like uncharacterized protein DUF3799 [Sediminihabitans luteus]|uniref:PDDEXK-like uncharacterized protein DUF3799 n=1 Tax=Sediminihabitans luteus TaxID=1138585 RepID=A0A2M9D0C8_9CELL|nr:PD-(D/E)XK nuclease-like domain-containing protein [Sediminihabitans luteus]PJJ77468.1 PDDEXK-like uncharacterized protein DUF3799 [Sediminihabitans luteus]GII98362.1 hypothetical protein Slu03_07400 [Sediminihabitans luteus]